MQSNKRQSLFFLQSFIWACTLETSQKCSALMVFFLGRTIKIQKWILFLSFHAAFILIQALSCHYLKWAGPKLGKIGKSFLFCVCSAITWIARMRLPGSHLYLSMHTLLFPVAVLCCSTGVCTLHKTLPFRHHYNASETQRMGSWQAYEWPWSHLWRREFSFGTLT